MEKVIGQLREEILRHWVLVSDKTKLVREAKKDREEVLNILAVDKDLSEEDLLKKQGLVLEYSRKICDLMESTQTQKTLIDLKKELIIKLEAKR